MRKLAPYSSHTGIKRMLPNQWWNAWMVAQLDIRESGENSMGVNSPQKQAPSLLTNQGLDLFPAYSKLQNAGALHSLIPIL